WLSSASSYLPDLHSFPTRRSSDLCGIKRCNAIRDPFLCFHESCMTTFRESIMHTNIVFSGVMREFTHRASEIFMLCRRTATMLRSEEHTSELQSRENLVCRLLLEK